MSQFTRASRSPLTRTGMPATLAASVAIGLGVLSVAGCAAPAPATSAPPVLASSRSIGDTLRGDPRFTDFVRIIDFAGLGHNLDNATNVTIFAPTNAAFDRSDPSWRERTSPVGTSNFSTANTAREQAIRETAVTGIHPPADFLGKLQNVKTVSGRVFQVNGLVDGAITITSGGANPTGMGFPVRPNQTARVEFPPLSATGGLIYPIDTVIR